MGDARHFETIQGGAGAFGKLHKKPLGPAPAIPVANKWLKYRDVQAVPPQSFRSWWKQNKEDQA